MSLDSVDEIKTNLENLIEVAARYEEGQAPANELLRAIRQIPKLPTKCVSCGGIVYCSPDCREEEEAGLTVSERKQRADLRSVRPGTVWRHYKGGLYLMLGRFKHSETLEELIGYVQLGIGTDQLEFGWARPCEMWLEDVDEVLENGDSYCGPRFRQVSVPALSNAVDFWGG